VKTLKYTGFAPLDSSPRASAYPAHREGFAHASQQLFGWRHLRGESAKTLMIRA